MSDQDNQPRRSATFQLPTPVFEITDEADSPSSETEALLGSLEAATRNLVFFSQTNAPASRGMMSIRRPVFSQNDFQRCFEEASVATTHRPSLLVPPSLPESPKDTRKLFQLFPFISVISRYAWRRDLLLDLLAGLTTGVMRIPQSIAYALLVGLHPSAGLYTAFFSGLFYLVFGSSHHLVIGAQGVVSLMIGSGAERFLEQHPERNNATDPSEAIRRIVFPITLLAGLLQMILGVLRLGFVTNYLSDPLIGGFTTGAACQVIASQLCSLLGLDQLHIPASEFKIPLTVMAVARQLSDVNIATFTVSIVTILLLGLGKVLNQQANWRVPVPIELMVMAAVILFSFFIGASERWGVSVVGPVPSGFVPPTLPEVGLFPQLFGVSFSVSIVSFAIGYSIAKRLAVKFDYEISGNREVFAFGFMNASSSFFHGFTATASMSMSALNTSLGGVSQLANMVACFVVLLVILFFGSVFCPAPKCLLSAIIVVNLKNMLYQFVDLKVLWRVSKIDFLLWSVTWLAVVILNVDSGLLIGVAFSLLTIVFRTQWPYACELGRIPATDLYKNRSINPEAITIEGVRIFRFEGSLYFASAEHFRHSLHKETRCHPLKLEKESLAFHSDNPPSTITRVHHIIIDFSTCGFIDSVGLRTLNQCVAEYRAVGIGIYLANVRAAVRAVLFNSGAGCEVSTKKAFLSVHDAVLAALAAARRMEQREQLLLDSSRRNSLFHEEQ